MRLRHHLRHSTKGILLLRSAPHHLGRKSPCTDAARGFTLVELMIATTVFAMVLLVLTAGIIQISRTYQKGIVQSKTLNVARAIADDVAQSIQFAGGTIANSPDPSIPGFCIGTRSYSPNPGAQVDGTGTSGVTAATVASCPTLPDSAVGQEMLGKGMRIARLELVDKGGGLYEVTVRVVYGDDDLLCSPSYDSASCTNDVAMSSTDIKTHLNDLRCKDISSGTQFCAVSQLTSTAVRRLST